MEPQIEAVIDQNEAFKVTKFDGSMVQMLSNYSVIGVRAEGGRVDLLVAHMVGDQVKVVEFDPENFWMVEFQPMEINGEKKWGTTVVRRITNDRIAMADWLRILYLVFKRAPAFQCALKFEYYGEVAEIVAASQDLNDVESAVSAWEGHMINEFGGNGLEFTDQ